MGDRPILTWEDGKSAKFFIQKDLPVETIENMSKQITEHGGTVQTKVPRQGFVLISPGSPEGVRLVGCWDTVECPKRFFVPFFFVDACMREGRLIPQVFRKDSKGVGIYVHESVEDRERLRDAIWCSGGNPAAAGTDVDVIIADSDWSGFQALVEKFSHSRNKYVEDVSWIENCINSGEYKHTPLIKKNLGGRVSGSKRTEFTELDDRNLAAYIALRLPEPAMRGRTGNKVYQELCDRPVQYPWATRHPWQSWRERFKNNVHKFNKLIKEYLLKHPTPEDRKGVHGFVRVPPSSIQVLALAKKSTERAVSPISEEDGWGSQWEIREGKKSPPTWSKRKDPESREASESPLKRQRTKEGAAQEVAQPVPGSSLNVAGEQGTALPSSQNSHSRASIAEDNDDYVEETDEAEEDSMGTQTQALLEANKEFIQRTVSEEGKQDSHDAPRSASTDVILTTIACEYGFLLSEVIQEFNELGCDLDATRVFFKDIREYIRQKKAHRKNN